MFKPRRVRPTSPDSAQAEERQAYAALDELKLQMNRAQDALWVVIEGVNEQQVETRLKQVEPILKNAVSTHAIQQLYDANDALAKGEQSATKSFYR